MALRVSTPALEGIYQGSKYLKFQVLCDPDELQKLFDSLGPVWIYLLTGVGNGAAIHDFGEEYRFWIEGLKRGIVPSDIQLRRILAAAMTDDVQALWKQEVPGGRYIIKISKPIVQIQAHFFTYSPIDEVFRPMTMGTNNIFWGLQFSYPQIYQEPKTMQLLQVEDSTLFQKIKIWVRECTRATPFVVNGKRTNVPIRLGKNCFSWIHNHPQLIEQKIGVYAN